MTGAESVGEPGYVREAIEAAAQSWDEAAWDPESWMPVTQGAPTQGLARHAAQEDAKSDARIILTAALPVLRAGWLAELGSDENVERVARELARQHLQRLYNSARLTKAVNVDETWRRFTDSARAVLGALTEGQAHE